MMRKTYDLEKDQEEQQEKEHARLLTMDQIFYVLYNQEHIKKLFCFNYHLRC